MKKLSLIAFTLFLSACAQPGKVGDECSADADCGEGLECHMHEGEEDHGECEEHNEEEHSEEEHSEEESGTSEG